ncbi:MAG: hypothetical protein SH807_06990 [Blastochloris sp.]|nr:hypothetical protein [Blastochloris sp.]
MKKLPALTRLADLDEVSACFVFDRQGKILASAIPPHYTEMMLQQIILVLIKVIVTVDRTKSSLRELRLTFESYGILIRIFGERTILAIFLQPGASPSILRQPINLAIVNLEKALLGVDDTIMSEATRSLADAAHQAELALLSVDGQDSDGSFARITTLAAAFFGPAAGEILEHGLRSKQLSLPLKDGVEMRALVSYCGDLIDSIEVKKIFLEVMDDLVERQELGLKNKATPKK